MIPNGRYHIIEIDQPKPPPGPLWVSVWRRAPGLGWIGLELLSDVDTLSQPTPVEPVQRPVNRKKWNQYAR